MRFPYVNSSHFEECLRKRHNWRNPPCVKPQKGSDSYQILNIWKHQQSITIHGSKNTLVFVRGAKYIFFWRWTPILDKKQVQLWLETTNEDLNMGPVWNVFMIKCYLLSGSRNRAWLKWKYRPQHPWLVLASPLASPQRPWPAQDPWVCSPPSTAQARPPHPPALLLQSDMGTPLCQPHCQVDCQESGGAAKGLVLLFLFTASSINHLHQKSKGLNLQRNKQTFNLFIHQENTSRATCRPAGLIWFRVCPPTSLQHK